MNEENKFDPRLGRIRAGRDATAKSYVRQVLRLTALAGGVAGSSSSRKRRFDGSRIGRGAGVGRVLADRHAAFRSRRVVIKTRLVRIGAKGVKAARLHLRYIQRDGVTRDGLPGELYDASQNRADGRAFLERSEGDRHQFRFIVAVEDAAEYEDLKDFTRRFMARMEADLGTKLDWVAVDHFNTGHPHTHVILRGKDEQDQDLVIAREYISRGMRERASEIANLDLGPRTDLEIEQRFTQEIDQDRLTSIDGRMIREASEQGAIDIRQSPPGAYGRFQQSLRTGRLQYLKRLGLADETEPGVWTLSKDLESTLRRLGERDDIIKTMHRAMTEVRIEHAPADYGIFDPAAPNVRLVGQIVTRGISDELNGRHYLILDGVDGRSHWVDVGDGTSVEEVALRSVVAIHAMQTGPRLADRTVAEIATQHHGLYSVEIHCRHDPSAGGEFVVAHVRRLEALRRANIVERSADGVWKIPSDFLEAIEALGRARFRKSPVAVEVLTTTRVEHLIKLDGATWLDRQLVSDEPSNIRDSGFGREVKSALAQRRQWLIGQGLAEQKGDRAIYRSNLIAILTGRELTRAAAQISGELGLPYTELGDAKRIEGTYRRQLDLVSGRFAVLERVRDFTLVPWGPVLERSLGKWAAGIARGDEISWSFGRRRSGPSST